MINVMKQAYKDIVISSFVEDKMAEVIEVEKRLILFRDL